jgi:MFS family permease
MSAELEAGSPVAAPTAAPRAAVESGSFASHKTGVLVGLMLTMGLAAMDSTIVGTAIPSIVRDLGGFSLFPWVFSVYLLLQAVTIPVYGKLADLHGRKPVLLVGVAVFLVGSALCGLSFDMLSLVLFRGVQAIGAGAVMSVTVTIVGDLYGIEERARIQGYLSSVWGIASILGPTLGGVLVDYASWRYIFYVNLPIGGFALVLVGTSLHERVARRPHRIDWLEAALLLGGMGGLVLGLLQSGTVWAWGGAASTLTLATGAALVAGFVWRERVVPEAVLPPFNWSSPALLGAHLGAFGSGVLLIGLVTYLPTFAQGVMGASALVAGFVLAAMSVGWPLASSVSGRLYLRVGFRDTALFGGAVAVGASVFFADLGADAGPGLLAVASFVLGVGLGFAATALLVGVQSSVGWERRGVVTGANMFMRYLGSALGAAVFGSIVNSTLSGYLRGAPPAVAAALPRSLNATALVLGGAPAVGPRAAAFVRHGLYLGVHRVFLASIAAAVAMTLLVLVMPGRRRGAQAS